MTIAVSISRPGQTVAKENRADLLVSIHANSAPNRDALGTEVYTSRSPSSRM